MFCFSRLSQYSNLFTFSGLKWNKLFVDFALPTSSTFYCVRVFGIFFNFSIVVLRTKLNPVVVCWKPWPFSWIFVVKTALIWLVLVGFFCVFSQSESICNLHSCYTFCTRVTEELHSFPSQSELSNFFVYIIIIFFFWRKRRCSLSKRCWKELSVF